MMLTDEMFVMPNAAALLISMHRNSDSKGALLLVAIYLLTASAICQKSF